MFVGRVRVLVGVFVGVCISVRGCSWVVGVYGCVLGSVVTGVRVGCMSVWAHMSACIQDVWDCVCGMCMGVHMYVCICAVVVCVSIGEQVWGVSGVRAVCLHNGVCLCGGLVWTSVDVGLCVCVRACTRVCRCVPRPVSWCTPCCCHLGGLAVASICIMLSIAAWW